MVSICVEDKVNGLWPREHCQMIDRKAEIAAMKAMADAGAWADSKSKTQGYIPKVYVPRPCATVGCAGHITRYSPHRICPACLEARKNAAKLARRDKRAFPEALKLKIIEGYNGGLTNKQIGVLIGKSCATAVKEVYRLRQAGRIGKRPNNATKQIDIGKSIIKLFNEGVQIIDIAHELGITEASAKDKLRRLIQKGRTK
jgi:hypothetical protein